MAMAECRASPPEMMALAGGRRSRCLRASELIADAPAGLEQAS
jgi:hypothetical protein